MSYTHPYRSCFFDKGIQFSCQRCGKCCTGSSGTIYVSEQEITKISTFLKYDEWELKEKFLYPFRDSYSIRERENGDCIFFDHDTGCIIQDAKPLQCATFPFWIENMRSRYRWKSISDQCTGIGKGKLYLKDEILSILKQSPL